MLDRLLQRALAKEPGKRFTSATAFNEAFQAALAQTNEPEASPAPAEPLAPAFAKAETPGAAQPGAAEHDAPADQAALHAPTLTPVIDDPAGERPTLPATPGSGQPRFPERRLTTTRPQPFQRSLLVVMTLLLAILIGGGAFLLANGFLIAPQSSSSVSQTPPGAGATTTPTAAPRITATRRPTATASPTATATSVPSPTAAGGAPHLTVTPASLSFSTTLAQCQLQPPSQSLTIQNSGGGTLNWGASVQDASLLSISPTSGRLDAGASQTMTVSLRCPTLPTNTTDTIHVTSNGNNVDVPVNISVT